MRIAAWRPRIALGVMFASGFAGLGYQIVWTQQAALWLGHEAAAVLAIVTAFFGGLAFGALALGARIERSRRPQRWYAACELMIALWSVVLAVAMAPVSSWALQLTGAQPHPVWQWAVAFVGSFVMLLPATAAMGATLPAMERVTMRWCRQGSAIGALYACNTAGAVLGVLAAAFWLVPAFGLARTAALCAALNLVCAIAAWRLSFEPLPQMPAAAHALETGTQPAGRHTLLLLAVTGLLGIGYEVLVVRVISQVSENTVYTFAILLAVYLVGTALGAAACQRWMANADRSGAETGAASDVWRERLLWLLGASCLLGTASLWGAEALRNAVIQSVGPTMANALLAETALALSAFALPTIVMGALFSQLGMQARAEGIGFHRALAANTLGATVAPLLFGVLLLPALGAKFSLLLVAAGYVLLATRPAWRKRGAWANWATARWIGAVGALAAVSIWAPPLVFIDIPEGGKLISYREGAMAAVSVVEDASGVSRLRIDNHQQEGSSATRFADAHQAWLPLLLHPAPRRVLFLGLGTGVTAAAAAEDAMLQVDAVELLPEVIAASAHFAVPSEGAAPSPRLHLIAADARRFVRSSPAHYDVIVSDNFHPARSGSGSLYTVEHFEAVKTRLTADGVFCQWLPLHQLDLPTLRSIVKSFVAVYPQASAMLATNSLETPVLGLVARAGADRIDLRALRERLSEPRNRQHGADFGLADDFTVLGGFVAGPAALAAFAGDAPLNTDDHPVVAYAAPRITYAPDSLPRDRLVSLLQQMHAQPAELIDAGAETAWPPRLAAYWAARDEFIQAGRGVLPSADVRAMLSQVREPLLAVLRTSPDFRPAYDPLLRMARALGRSDVAAAQALLITLMQAQPARPEAALALRQLAGASP